MSKEDHRDVEVPLSAALLAENPNRGSEPGLEREQMLSSLHSRMFGAKKSVLLGRFELGARRGAGAMGVVYEARDPALDRKVALKVLRATALDPSRAERFVLEARALAKLRHPNVVTVYEVGSDGENRFIVMDLVQGGTLGSWLDTPRPWRDIVRMFIGAGHGLQAAHDAGLVHRDFKPDNVLVENELPRVVDFGLAAGADDPLTTTLGTPPQESSEAGRCTQTGGFVGTPVYMAPEQARGDTTPAADQYAFCVALFEALEGRRPHADAEPKGLEAMLAARETPLPPGVPRNAPRWLRKAIVRGLAPSPGDRWPSMNDLLSTLQRVEGAGRRRTAAVVGGLALTVGAAGVGTLWSDTAADPCAAAAAEMDAAWSSNRRTELAQAFSDTKLPYADDTWQRVSSLLEAYAQQWGRAAERACVADLAAPDPAPALNLARQRCIERRRSDFTTLVNTFAKADADTIDRAVDAAATIPPLSTCDDAALLREQLERGSERQIAPSGLYDLVAASDVAFRIGDDDTALREAGEALEGARAIPDHELATLASLVVAKVQKRSGNLEEATASASDAVEAAELLGGTSLRAQAQLQLLDVLIDLREFDSSTRLARFTRASVLRLGDPPPLLLELGLREASLAHSKGDVEAGLKLFERTEALARQHDDAGHDLVGRSLQGQGNSLSELGRYDESIAVQQRAVELLARRLGTATPRVIEARMGVASALSNYGRSQEGLAQAKSTFADANRVAGEGSVLAARAQATLGIAYATHGMLSEAEPLLRVASTTLEKELGPENPDAASGWTALARVLAYLDKPQEAIEVLEHAREILSATLSPTHTDFIYIHTNLAEAHLTLEQWQAAADAAQRAESIVTVHFSADNGRLAPIRRLRATALREAGKLAASAELLRSVVTQLQATDAQPALIAVANYQLALTLAEQGETAQAKSLMQEARAVFATLGNYKKRLATIDSWLAQH